MAELLDRLRVALAGRYEPERELGRGGMATVYLARDLRHRRSVALKVLRPELAASIGPERFLREIEIAAGLTHPHILPLFDSGEVVVEQIVGRRSQEEIVRRRSQVVDDQDPTTYDVRPTTCLYYVMPYVEGETLRDRLKRERQLAVDDAVGIARQVALALDYAHQHGIVHRDIKPENILLEEGEAVVADFGVARAVRVAAEERLSEPGLVVGTPAYMSPEQAAGDDLDGRSDIYSLGCVLYEMLAGEPPFTGPSAQAVLARHQSEPPRPLHTGRPVLPPELEEATLTALAKLPADRYRNAEAFARALGQIAAGGSRSGVGARPAGRRPLWRRLRWLAGLAGVAGIAGIMLLPHTASPTLDESLFLVAPFAHRGAATPEPLNGELCESLLHRAASRWEGIRLVDPLWVSDARARHDIDTVRLGQALTLARERGAGRLFTGEVFSYRDTLHVYAALYDVADRKLLRTATATIAPDLSDVVDKFNLLARSLITGTTSLGTTTGPEALGTRSVAAWRAFDDGLRAFRRWNLDSSRERFQTAIALDDAYPQPHLWLAQLFLIVGDDSSGWRSHAREAVRHAGSLAHRDRAHARALAALADGRYPDACAAYTAQVAADSLDFFAWYGLGECRRRDRLIVADSRSPSGWRFRSSLQAALNAYRRALAVIPSSHAIFRDAAYGRLSELFLTEPTYFRAGFRVAGDTIWYGAWPGLDHDTLALVPFPVDDLFAGRPGTEPATHGRAVDHGRELLRDVAAVWVEAFPASADAREALAQALESLSELADRPGTRSALTELRAAARLTADAGQRLRLKTGEVRLLVKLEQFAGARRLADSLLGHAPAPTPEAARQLAGLAALTGRVHETAAHLRTAARSLEPLAADGTPIAAPPAVLEASATLLAYASIGVPADSIRASAARAGRLIESYFEPADHQRVSSALLGRAAEFAFFDAGLRHSSRGREAEYIQQIQWDLAAGDSADARRELAEARRLRTGRPGDIGIESTFKEALLLVALGDSAAAARHLDATLIALPTLGVRLLPDVPQAASLVRAMALRARLAAEQGDTVTAARWAHAVRSLWGGTASPAEVTVQDLNAL